MNKTIDYYTQHSADFKEQYLSKSAEEVHDCWLKHLPKNGQALDVGAGVGRDALWLANLDFDVIAVEPSNGLKKQGQTLTKETSVHWVDDQLPALSKVEALNLRFDLILLSAVWMHIPSSQRQRAFRKLANLLKPNGKLVISLRHGSSPDEREMYPVDKSELAELANQFGLSLTYDCDDIDKLDRPDVYWETVVYSLPDDGSGAFPLIRNILINDAKSSTYKLALIRSLLRIADGYPGSVISRDEKHVTLPLGLVSLFWARQYRPLVDQHIQQNAVSSKGLGFIKSDGWLALNNRSPLDLSVGQFFIGDEAKALHKMLKDIGQTIKNMPAKYITLPGSKNRVFEVSTSSKRFTCESLFTDIETLSQYGEFLVPRKIWDLMSQYACWIEPVAVNEWVNVMKGYQNNQGLEVQSLHQALAWSTPERTTTKVRQRVEQIRKEHTVECVWSHKKLSNAYAIDHCLPFARWPNNDLWNLLPTSSSINMKKSDSIPSQKRFLESKEKITDWWTEAWLNCSTSQKQFIEESRFALPGLENTSRVDDIFEALMLQSIRVTEMQQLRVW
jgi:SAM-dependent methyltransferase